LLIAHPFAPFVTETIWQTLEWEPDSVLAMRRWPKIHPADDKLAEEFSELQAVISESRLVLSALGVSDITLYHTGVDFLAEHAELIKRMARLKAVSDVADGNGLFLTGTKYRCWLDITSDDARHYAQKLKKKYDAQEKFIGQLEGRLANKSYVENAPVQLVEETNRQLEDAKIQLDKLQTEIDRYGG
jgi:valyl-tRNA synthetase